MEMRGKSGDEEEFVANHGILRVPRVEQVMQVLPDCLIHRPIRSYLFVESGYHAYEAD